MSSLQFLGAILAFAWTGCGGDGAGATSDADRSDRDGGTRPLTDASSGARDGGTSGFDGGPPSEAEDSGTTPDMADAGVRPVPSNGPPAEFVPRSTGTCPTLSDGTLTFAPQGVAPRNVRIYMPEGPRSGPSPLVFYWHGTGSSPLEARFGLPLTDMTAAGWIVAAPEQDSGAGAFPWFLTASSGPSARLDDILVADEVLACAHESIGVDLTHVHSLGMSAGGLHTAQMSIRRSGYLASVVTYSGGLSSSFGVPAFQHPANHLAAMIFHGGSSDVVFGLDFQMASTRYQEKLADNGNFAFVCNHGGGHSIPREAADQVFQFFRDHPYGTSPSPYAGGLPSGFPSYCVRP